MLVSPVSRDPLALLDQWAHLECQANQEWENPVPQVIQVSPVRMEPLEEMEPQVQWVCQDLRVTLEPQAQELQVNQVRMAPLACLDQWDLKVHKVQLGSQVPLECQVLVKLESLELQAAEVLLVLPEPQDRRESLVPLVSLVTQVLPVPLAQQVHRVQEDSKGKEAHRGLKVTLAWLVLLVPEEPRVSKELKDSLENLVFPVQLVLLELQATMVLRVLRVPRVTLVPLDSQDPMVLLDTKDTQVPQVLQENPESQEDKDLWAKSDQLDHLVLLDLKDTLDLLGPQDPLA